MANRKCLKNILGERNEIEMAKQIMDENLKALFKAILSLENFEECTNFFEDICTITELKAMSQRLEVAKLLKQNIIYSEIAARTGASTATISRVSKCLNYGNDGYEIVIKRLEDMNKNV